jgi:hypothetical protein
VYITEHTYNMRIQRTGQAGSITVTPNNAINVSDNDSSGAVTNIVFSDDTVDIVGNTATVASGGGGTLTIQETGDTNSDTADTIEFPEGSVTHDGNDKATISLLAGVITEYGANAGLTDSMFPNGLFGDIDQNGTVATQDLLAVLSNFGATLSPGANQVARSLERAQAQISDGNGGTFNHLRDKDAADVVTTIEGQGYDVEFFEGVNTALGRGFKSQYGSDTVADATVRRTLYISATPFPSSLASMQQYPLGPYDNQSETLVQTVVDAYLEGLNGNGSIIVIREEVSSTPDKLLDTYSGAAAAYSVRKLDKDYTGNCMRIRRDSDDAETDIGFDSSGDLDTSAISSHGGSSSCFVVTWYDQSGNSNNATQSTAGSQPQIYNGTAVIVENGKPAVDFDGFNDNLDIATSLGITGSQARSTFFVLRPESAGGTSSYQTYFGLGDGGQDSNGQIWDLWPEWSVRVFGGFEKYNTVTINNQYLSTNILSGTNVTDNAFFLDGTEQTATSSTVKTVNTDNAVQRIGRSGSSSTTGPYYTGKMQEIVIYASAQTTNRTGIETDINGYFSIYS